MDNKQTDFEAIIKKACEDSLDEEYEQYLKDTEAHVQLDPITEKKAMKKIRIALLKTSRRYKTLKKTVVTCVLALVIFTGVSVTVEPVRAYFGKIVEKWFDNSLEVTFTPEENKEYPKYIKTNLLPKLDEGWTIEPSDNNNGYYLITSPTEKKIYYSQNTIHSGIWINDKNATIEEIKLKNGAVAHFYTYENDYIALIWENEYIFSLDGYGIPKDTLIRIANTIE